MHAKRSTCFSTVNKLRKQLTHYHRNELVHLGKPSTYWTVCTNITNTFQIYTAVFNKF